MINDRKQLKKAELKASNFEAKIFPMEAQIKDLERSLKETNSELELTKATHGKLIAESSTTISNLVEEIRKLKNQNLDQAITADSFRTQIEQQEEDCLDKERDFNLKSQTYQSWNSHSDEPPDIDTAVKVVSLYDVNPFAQEVKIKKGPFIFSSNIDEEFAEYPVLGPYKDNKQGFTYEGQYKLGKRHGRGLEVWANGAVYDGYWENDKKSMQGRLIHADGGCYEGQWENGLMSGKGVFESSSGYVYEGEWNNDEQHGYGEETWPNGDGYQGQFVNGMIHGHGEYSQKNSRKYVGEYAYGKQHGYGELYFPDNSVHKGHWINGKLEGKVTVIDGAGIVREGIWKDDVRVEWCDEYFLPFFESLENKMI